MGAVGALVRLLPGVGAHVGGKSGHLTRLVRAVQAGERALSCVYACVDVQLGA